MSDEPWNARGVHWTDEELAHADSGLGSTVVGWWEALRRGVGEVVWWAMDPDFRLVVAQQWLGADPAVLRDPAAGGRDRDELAAALAVERPDHPLRGRLEAFALRALREAGGLGDQEVGAPVRSTAVAPGIEVVQLVPLARLPVDRSGTPVWPPGAQVEGLSVVMRFRGDAWRIAGLGWIPVPGWPPRYDPLPRELLGGAG